MQNRPTPGTLAWLLDLKTFWCSPCQRELTVARAVEATKAMPHLIAYAEKQQQQVVDRTNFQLHSIGQLPEVFAHRAIGELRHQVSAVCEDLHNTRRRAAELHELLETEERLRERACAREASVQAKLEFWRGLVWIFVTCAIVAFATGAFQ